MERIYIEASMEIIDLLLIFRQHLPLDSAINANLERTCT